MMSEEGSFPRLMELIQRLAREGRVQVQVQDQDHNQEQEQEQEQSQAQSQDAHSSKVDDDDDDGQNLQRGLMDLLYEMARIQRLRIEDLSELDPVYIFTSSGVMVVDLLAWQFSLTMSLSSVSLRLSRSSPTTLAIPIIIPLYVCWLVL